MMAHKTCRGVLREWEWLEPYDPGKKLGTFCGTLVFDRHGFYEPNYRLTVSGSLYVTDFGDYFYLCPNHFDYYYIVSKKTEKKKEGIPNDIPVA